MLNSPLTFCRQRVWFAETNYIQTESARNIKIHFGKIFGKEAMAVNACEIRGSGHVIQKSAKSSISNLRARLSSSFN